MFRHRWHRATRPCMRCNRANDDGSCAGQHIYSGRPSGSPLDSTSTISRVLNAVENRCSRSYKIDYTASPMPLLRLPNVSQFETLTDCGPVVTPSVCIRGTTTQDCTLAAVSALDIASSVAFTGTASHSTNCLPGDSYSVCKCTGQARIRACPACRVHRRLRAYRVARGAAALGSAG